MSDASATRPLFPPRDNANMPPPHLGGPGPSLEPTTASAPASVERTVIDVFARRIGNQAMSYLQARQLVALEQDLILELTKLLGKAPS
jgi:hypothetical protein